MAVTLHISHHAPHEKSHRPHRRGHRRRRPRRRVGRRRRTRLRPRGRPGRRRRTGGHRTGQAGLGVLSRRSHPRAGVRDARRAGGLLRPARPQDPDQARPPPRHRAQGEAAGADPAQPRRPRDLRALDARLHLRQAPGRRRLDLRLDRLRPARHQRQRTPRGLRPALLRRRAPRLPGGPGHREGLAEEGGRLRVRLRGRLVLAAPAHDHRRQRARHGQHPAGARRAEDQLLRRLLGHLAGLHLRPALPVPGPADGPRQHRRTDHQLVRAQQAPGQGAPAPLRGLHRLDRQGRRRLPPRHRPRRGPQGLRPGRGRRSARPSSRTPSTAAATTSCAGPGWPPCSPPT